MITLSTNLHITIVQTKHYPVFHTIIVLMSLDITAGIHNSLLFQPHRPEVSDFVFKNLNSFSSVLMDQISHDVLKPGISISQGSVAAVCR